MKLIVGLGNPGEKYRRTRHNAGFMVLDEIAKKSNVGFKVDQKHQSVVAEFEKNKLVKPQTFMNESGRSIRSVKDFYKIDNQDIWVIHDDVDLEFGKVRVQNGGSSAGHKGIQSVIDYLDEDFWRVRVGVGKSEKISTDDWVLMNFDKAEEERLNIIIDAMAEHVIESLIEGIKEQTINVEEPETR